MAAIYTSTCHGYTDTRRSDGHDKPHYTYAVWGKSVDSGNSEDSGGDGEAWVCLCYRSRRELADREAARARKWHNEVSVEPVTCELKMIARKPIVDFPAVEFLELEGVTFVRNAPFRSRRGEYKGWQIELHCTGVTFSAMAFKPPHKSGTLLYTQPSTRLDTRVQDIIKRIDQEIERQAAA